MGQPIVYNAKLSQKERNTSISLCEIWKVKSKANEQVRQIRIRVIDTENKQVVARGDKSEVLEEKMKGLRNTNFQLQIKWVTDVKSTVWGAYSILIYLYGDRW